ncbi:hypothetical protein D779_4021 [Imhoffiella purpurea]|uniref:Uncharacterized protein n=2 Tax=Imhoffiella purpurea TaxID=1249627 RepID=W9UZI5_9GAMM|nr:hypothetical protein D779_4021 [Imhoffiella purpurea]
MLLLGASLTAHSTPLSTPWTHDPNPSPELGESLATTCIEDEDISCLSVICREGSLYLEFDSFSVSPDERTFGVDIDIDGEHFWLQLRQQDTPIDYGTWHAATPVDTDGDLIQALMSGRSAKLSSKGFSGMDFSLRGSSPAIDSVRHHCADTPSISHGSRSDSGREDADRIVAEATGGHFSRIKGFVTDDCGEKAGYSAELVDLNDDGQPEVFVSLEGTCSGGMTGVWMDLYIKDRRGRWQSQFGFPGIYEIRKTKHKGFPDIEIGGPGFCFPVWRWNGRKYVIHERCD